MDDVKDQGKISVIPVELWTRITRQLDTHSLCNLRSTCRVVEHRTRGSFAKTFFTKKQFMITTPSLQALVDISRHETFSQTLRHVCFGTDNYSLTHFGEQVNDAVRAGFVDQFWLISTALWRGMVVDALRRLPNLLSIHMRDYNSPTKYRDGPGAVWRSCGAVTAEEKTGKEISMTNSLDTVNAIRLVDTLFQNILLAMVEADVRPINFELTLKAGGVSDYVLYVQPQLRPVLEGFTKLHLDLNNRTWQSNRHLSPRGNGLKQFIAACPNLTSLRINFQRSSEVTARFYSWLAGEVADDDEDSIPPPELRYLKRLELGMCDLHESIPDALLARFESTLESITFWRIRLYHTDSRLTTEENLWAKFLEHRSGTATKLREIVLGNLRQRQGGNLYDNSVYFASSSDPNTLYKIRRPRGPPAPGEDDCWTKAAKDVMVKRRGECLGY